MAGQTKSKQEAPIQLSRRAVLYFFGYHWWAAFKKLFLWVLILIVAITALSLTRSAQIFGMADGDIAKAFIAPLPYTLVIFISVITVYALLRAVISAKTTKYAFTPKGVVIQSGWPTRRTTIVDYAHIQKMTIVSNSFDRMLRAAYVQLDLIGGAPGILLEAVDSRAVNDIQERLSIPNNALLAAVTSNLDKPSDSQQQSRRVSNKHKDKKKPKATTKTTAKANNTGTKKAIQLSKSKKVNKKTPSRKNVRA